MVASGKSERVKGESHPRSWSHIPMINYTMVLLMMTSTICMRESLAFALSKGSPARIESLLRMASTTSALVAKRAVGKLYPQQTAMLLVDIQERFRPLIFRSETIIRTAQYMTSVAKALDIPIVATQQYTKVFGPTVPECFATAEDLNETPIFEKKLFSMCTDEVSEHLAKLNRSSYIIFGIEAHVCVQQTALDLLEQGHDVHVIVDGVSSQQPFDRKIALKRLSQAGAFLTTAQSAAFMLMQSADHSNFKTVSKLTVEHMKLPNEFNDALVD